MDGPDTAPVLSQQDPVSGYWPPVLSSRYPSGIEFVMFPGTVVISSPTTCRWSQFATLCFAALDLTDAAPALSTSSCTED